MTSSGNQPHGGSSLLGVVVAAATIVAAVAGVVALKEGAFIIATGLISGVVIAAIALHAIRRNDKAAGVTAAAVAVVIMAATLIYGVTLGPPKIDGSQTETPTTQLPQPSPDDSTPTPSPKKNQPAFQGSVKITAGQAIDLETPNPKAKRTAPLVSPEDIIIDPLAFAYDRDGYLIMYTGNPGDAKADCRELLESGQTRQAVFALPNMWYCATTSEGRMRSFGSRLRRPLVEWALPRIRYGITRTK